MTFPLEIRERDGLRTLHFGSDRIQGAMRIVQPWELALEYTRVMMTSLLLREAQQFPRKVLLIGLGAGSQAKFLYRHCPRASITIVEIEPSVIVAAREHFSLPDDPSRLQISLGDGAAYVQSTDMRFDLILVDGFNQHAHPGDLNTLGFYAACRERLDERGVLAVNLIGLSEKYLGGYRHIEAAFGTRTLLLPRCISGNTIALATCGEPVMVTVDELRSRAQALEEHSNLALLPLIDRLDTYPACQGGFLRL